VVQAAYYADAPKRGHHGPRYKDRARSGRRMSDAEWDGGPVAIAMCNYHWSTMKHVD
jgi:hypothetical protein